MRSQRERRGWSRRELAERSGVSERFLAQLETGDGNISLRRFAEVAHALGTTPSVLLAAADAPADVKPIALLGVRGAGKSTVGAALAKKLGVRVRRARSADRGGRRACRSARCSRCTARRTTAAIEREVLTRLLADAVSRWCSRPAARSSTTRPTTPCSARAAHTIWLRARPEDHWNRVVAQGDQRPMAENPHAFAELRALLAAREKLYARADHTVDTSGLRLPQVVTAIAHAV